MIDTPQNSQPPTATCDECQRRFEIRSQAELMRGGELQFFVCPHCGHRYEYALISLDGLRLRQMLEDLRRLRRQRDSDRLREIYDRTLASYRQEVRGLIHSSPVSPDPRTLYNP